MADESVDLIYIDPPFNAGREQIRRSLKTTHDQAGDRRGFEKTYFSEVVSEHAYQDSFSFRIFFKPRLLEAWRILKKNGSFYFHIDYREVHYCKILLDQILARIHS